MLSLTICERGCPRRLAVRRLLSLTAVLAISTAALLVPSAAIQAQEPEPISATRGTGVTGIPPATGGIALMLSTEAGTPNQLTATLADLGCDAETIAVVGAPPWRIYVPAAPGFVNADFPANIAADTPFFVRCASVMPAIDPANATYVIGGTDVTLTDGLSQVPAAPGSATLITTMTTSRQSSVDLNGDALTDAAVILTHDPGGSGTFYYLAVVEAGATGAAPTLLLGDRIVVDGVTAAHGQIVVQYLDRAPGEPFAVAPTVPRTRTFKLVSGAFIEVGAGACEAANLADVGSFVFVTAPASGARVFSGFTVEGCSRTFESTVNWQLFDREGNELASGFTMGGGVDGPGRFSFTVTYDGALTTEEVGRLEVFEADVSGGEGFPPPKAVVPLVLP